VSARGLPLMSEIPEFLLPSLPDALKPPRFIRSATFEVTYLDAELRITRGDRGELRLYLLDSNEGPSAV